MKKPIYWTALFGLWLASLDLNRGKNTLHNIKKHFEDSKFLSFDPNLKRNKKFKHKDVKKKSFKSLETDSVQQFDKEISKVNREDPTGIIESDSASFISLGNASLKNEPSDGGGDEVVLRTDGGGSDTDKDSGKLEKSEIPDVENAESVSKCKIVLEDYVNKLKESNPYFLMEVDYVNLQSFKEIRNLIPEGKEYHKFYDEEMDKKVTDYTNRLDALMKKFIGAKNEMIKMDAIVKIHKKGSTELKQEAENVKKLELAKEQYEKYMKEYNDDIKPIVHEIRNKAYEHLKQSSCTHQCNAYIMNYARLLNKYIKNISETTDESVVTIVKSINDYNSLDKILELAERENIDIAENVYLLKLLGEEVNDLNYVYVINRSLINDANKVLMDIKENGILFHTKEDKIVNSTKELINNYCVFHHIMILNVPIKKMYEERIKRSNDLFSTIMEKLKDEAHKLINSVFVEEESNKILKSSEGIVQNAEKILEENKKKIDFFKRYSEIKTKPPMEELQTEFSQQEEARGEILNMAQLIDHLYNNLFHVNKTNHLNKLNEIAQYGDSITKGNLLLEEISEINKERNVLKVNIATLKNVHGNLVRSKNNIVEIVINVDNTSEVDELKEKEEKLAKYMEEINEKIKDMIKKMHKLKEVIVLRDKANQDVITINELLNGGSNANLEEFISKKNKANDDINSIFKTLYSGDVYDLIETVGTFVREKRKIVGETFSAKQIDQVEQYLSEVRVAHANLDTLTHEKLINAYDQLSAEENNTEKLKNDLVKKKSEDLYKKMADSLKTFKTEYADLVRNMEEYEREEKILEQCMGKTLKKEEEHFNTLQVDGEALKDTYNCAGFEKLRGTFSQRKFELSQKIDHVKGVVTNMEKLLKSYSDLEKHFLLLDDSDYVKRVETLRQTVQREMMNKKMSVQEDSFKRRTESVLKTIKIFESLNKTIHFHNHLNRSINECEGINVSINSLKGKTVALKGELQKEIDDIGADQLISEAVKVALLDKLKAELGSVNSKLDETHMDDLLKKSTDLNKFYRDSKSDLHEKRQEYPVHYSLEKVNDWEEIKTEVHELNAHYNAFNDNKAKLILANSRMYLESIYNLIKELVHNTREEKDKMERSLKGIEKSVETIELNQDYKNAKVTDNENEIKNINEDTIPKIKERIDEYSRKLTKFEEQSDSLNNKDTNKGSDVTLLLDVIRQMKGTYQELKKIPTEMFKERDEIRNTEENVNKVQFAYERKLIEQFLKRITQKRNEAEEQTQQISAIVKQIEGIRKETGDPIDKELTTTNCEKHLHDAEEKGEEIKQIEELSTKLRGEAATTDVISEVIKIKEQVYAHLEKATSNSNHVSEALNTIKEMKELILSESYNSVINFILRNVNDAHKYVELVKMELLKIEDATDHVKIRFEEAKKLKEKIKTDVDDEGADHIIKEIEEIRKVILNEIKDTSTFLTNAEKGKENCLLHFENAKGGKAKFDYLKEHGDGEHKRISHSEINMVEENMTKVKQHTDEADKDVEQTKKFYYSILGYEKLINDLLNESLLRKVKLKCEKLRTEVDGIMDEMERVDVKAKEESIEQEQKVKQMKEQSIVEGDQPKELNEESMNALLQIKNYRQKLDDVMLSIKSVEENMEQFLRNAGSYVKTTLDISQLRNENSFDNLTAAEENYKIALRNVQNEKQRMISEEKRLAEMYRDIISVGKELEEQKKRYEVGLLKGIKENADRRLTALELTKKEVNSLVDPSKSIFFKFKLDNLDETDIMKYLYRYADRIYHIFDEFVKLYKMIEGYLSQNSDPSVTFNEVKMVREKAQMEEMSLGEKEEESKEVLRDMKKKESIRLLNEMMEMLNSAKERVTEDHAKVSNYVENVKKDVTDLKVLDDVNNGANVFNKAMNSVNEIKDAKYMNHRKEAENIYENMIQLANYFLDDDVRMESTGKLSEAAFAKAEPGIVSDIFGKIKEAKEIVEKIEEESIGIQNKQIEGERLSTEANHIYSVAKLKNEFNNKKNEAKLKVIFVLAEIEEALHKLKSVNKVKCHYDNYDNYNDILENNEEHENFKQISSTYKLKKAQIAKEADINEMKNDANMYKDKLASLDKNGETFNDGSDEISTAQKYKTDVEGIIDKLNVIDETINGINSTLDELLELGNNCQLHRTFLISSSLNNKIAKFLVEIREQKENTKKCFQYVKRNHQHLANFVSELHKTQGGIFDNVNLVDNTPDADKYYHEFMEIEQEATKIVKDIKKEIYHLNDDVDEPVLEKRIKDVINTYNKLKTKKVQMDQSYKNMYITKLREVEGSHDLFNQVAQLIRGETDKKGKALSERENNLHSIYNFVKLHETELHNLYAKYTPEYMEKINKIFDDINARMIAVDLNDDHSSEYSDVKRHEHEAMLLMDATNNLSKEVEMMQNESGGKNDGINGGKSQLVEDYTNTMSEFTEQAKTVAKKIHDSKGDYANMFDHIRENEAMLERIDLKKKDIKEILAHLNKMKEYLLKKLSEEEKLHHMREKLEEVNTSTDEIVKKFRTYDQMVDISQNIDIKNVQSKRYDSVDEIDKEMSYIKTHNKDLIDSKFIVERALENDKRKKSEMAQIFSTISRDNSSMYEYAKSFFDSVLKEIEKLTQMIRNMDKLINENEAVMEKLKDQRRELQNVENASTDLGKLEEVDKMAQTKSETELSERNDSRNAKDGATYSTLMDDKETDSVNGEETKQENVVVKKGLPPQTDIYTSGVLKNDRNDQKSEKIGEKKSNKPVGTEENIQHSSYLNNDNSNNDIDVGTLYTLGGYNAPNDNYNTNESGDDINEEAKKKRNAVLFVYVGGLFSALFICIGAVFYLLHRKIGIEGVGKSDHEKKPTIEDTKIEVFEETYGLKRNVKDEVIDVPFVDMEDNL
ncbi:reticulocyte binding protein 1b [Plasmodium vivax]|uniref:Reticulocyte binding protein 1b n=1 Tax=Plasmodium vivax TaxID=5855 RepID=A0A564ZTB2_PLAVI|nr:reticulocyte binding protein 1b [Plasmodium vivax]